MPRRGRADVPDDERVSGDATMGTHHNRVHVDFYDVIGKIDRKFRYANNHLGEGWQIHRRQAAVALQQAEFFK